MGKSSNIRDCLFDALVVKFSETFMIDKIPSKLAHRESIYQSILCASHFKSHFRANLRTESKLNFLRFFVINTPKNTEILKI